MEIHDLPPPPPLPTPLSPFRINVTNRQILLIAHSYLRQIELVRLLTLIVKKRHVLSLIGDVSLFVVES